MNEKIIKWFELLIKQLQFYVDVKTGKDKLIYSFKVNSIQKSLKIIKNIKFNIKTGEQLKDIKGIGKGTINRINEILKTNKLSEVNDADISGTHLKYVEDLMKIFGIGRTKAYELYTINKITSIKELKKAVKNKKVKLPSNIMKGLKYVDKINTKIPRDEIIIAEKYLIKKGIELDPDMSIIICGSYRREKKESGDIDIIISHPKLIKKSDVEKSKLLQNYISLLENDNFIIDNLTSKNVLTKYMGICQVSKNKPFRRIDMRLMPEESYYTSILYFTGSADHNVKMRRIAISMGYTLNEYFLLNEKKNAFKINSEKDIFEKLNMEYLQPKYRK
jgi:DNA polymerase/3'-5' exonuclease PolX